MSYKSDIWYSLIRQAFKTCEECDVTYVFDEKTDTYFSVNQNSYHA